jgi:prepilin-type N-terminal cleavage/methylation domain-containing protein
VRLKEDEKRTDVKGHIVRKDKEKKTVNLRHWLRRIRCSNCGAACLRRDECCSQECRCDLRARGGGFTLAEVLLVVLIIAIAAMIAVPMMGSMDSVQIRSAANMIAADLEYAKSMAISRQKYYSVVFNPANSYYEVHDPNGIIEHPVTKLDYRVDFSSDSRLDKVVIESADFAPGSSNTITFDYLGSPHSGSGASPPDLNSGAISLRAGDFTMTINVEPVTGFISITD